MSRGQLGTAAAAHASGATVTALSNDWYAGFTAVPAGAQNLKVTYKGANCATTTPGTCTALTTNVPQQTVKICNWTDRRRGRLRDVDVGRLGHAARSAGTAPAASGRPTSRRPGPCPNPASAYVGTGANHGQIRVLVHIPALHPARTDRLLDLGEPPRGRLRRAMTRPEQTRRLAMPARTRTRITALVVLVLAWAGLTLVSPSASAASVALNLCARAGTTTLPGRARARPDLGLRRAD